MNTIPPAFAWGVMRASRVYVREGIWMVVPRASPWTRVCVREVVALVVLVVGPRHLRLMFARGRVVKVKVVMAMKVGPRHLWLVFARGR
jgi:hypothetical protein